MKWFVLVLIMSSALFGFSQESYNNCANALELCPANTYSINNLSANKTLCAGCEDDLNFCFSPVNSIWMKFTTNENGGAISIQFSNLVFQTGGGLGNAFHANLIQANIPCNAASYTLIGNCVSNVTGNQQITATNLLPNTTYYIVMSGSKQGGTLEAEFNANVAISGAAVDRVLPWMNIGMDTVLCANQTNIIMADRLNCTDPGSFKWFVNGELIAETSVDSMVFPTALQTGDVVTVTSSCFSTCPVQLTQSIGPITVVSLLANAGNDVTIHEGETVQLQGEAGPTSTVLWSPSFDLSNPTVRFPVANPSETTVFTFTVTDSITGCVATDYVTVFVDNSLLIPNTFSPNEDGDNDRWVIKGMEQYPDSQVHIYDRWGQPVFYSIGYPLHKTWDGTSKRGSKLNEGVYFYKIELRDSEEKVLKGTITLIR